MIGLPSPDAGSGASYVTSHHVLGGDIIQPAWDEAALVITGTGGLFISHVSERGISRVYSFVSGYFLSLLEWNFKIHFPPRGTRWVLPEQHPERSGLEFISKGTVLETWGYRKMRMTKLAQVGI